MTRVLFLPWGIGACSGSLLPFGDAFFDPEPVASFCRDWSKNELLLAPVLAASAFFFGAMPKSCRICDLRSGSGRRLSLAALFSFESI